MQMIIIFLNISKDGKKYVFDNYQFNVPQKQLRSFQVIVVKLYKFGDKHHISVERR